MSDKKKPLILVCNDDGIFSKGIMALVEVADEFGDVEVVAPDRQQSAVGHAIPYQILCELVHLSWIADLAVKL